MGGGRGDGIAGGGDPRGPRPSVRLPGGDQVGHAAEHGGDEPPRRRALPHGHASRRPAWASHIRLRLAARAESPLRSRRERVTIPDLFYLVGPTAVGKTAVAIALARRIGGEILSIDSRQAYRDLEIGTAKPTPDERHAVPHHLLDLFDPTEVASAARFREAFRRGLESVHGRGRRALAVGGAGLYVDACLGRLDPLPPADPAIRARHRAWAEREGSAALHARLREVDPPSAKRIAPADLKRISRALEVYERTGIPMSRQAHQPEGPWPLTGGPPMVLLSRPREELYARIRARAHAMVEAGLAAEVRALLDRGVPSDAPGLASIGYAEFVRAARGEISEAQALDLLIQATRRYAKRQLAWFRNRYAGLRELEIRCSETAAQTAQRVLDALADRPPST
ncbi:MAG: tRNA (adenosine(37)-N6)-dimethylallyltransferase MiaA [Candidatus Eisenbacteria bacterium]|nr:tRNA (adenosine(37)-N6)-dimethylallyltransferase MiaA [Candidatus Eisenbacteria bacterium]